MCSIPLPGWQAVFDPSRQTHEKRSLVIDPIVYRKLCKEARVNFYREKVSSASTPAEWGKILRWRFDHSDD
jgi:hypothetical protein